MVQRRDAKLSAADTKQTQKTPTPMERLQLSASALEAFQSVKAYRVLEGYAERGWGFPLAWGSKPEEDTDILHESGKNGGIAAIALVGVGGKKKSKIRCSLQPKSENHALLSFLRAAKRMAPLHGMANETLAGFNATLAQGGGDKPVPDPFALVMGPEESILRAAVVRLTDLEDTMKGNGYLAVVRNEVSGEIRVLVRGMMGIKMMKEDEFDAVDAGHRAAAQTN